MSEQPWHHQTWIFIRCEHSAFADFGDTQKHKKSKYHVPASWQVFTALEVLPEHFFQLIHLLSRIFAGLAVT